MANKKNGANVCNIANNANENKANENSANNANENSANNTALTVSIGGITRIDNKLNIEQRKMLSAIAVKYGDGAKDASRNIMAMQNIINAVDIATSIEVYNAIESIKKKTNRLNGAVKEWSTWTGIEYTKVSKLQSIYTTIYAQLDDTIQHTIICDIATTEQETVKKTEDIEETKMQYLSRFTYNQLVELMALKREEIRYIVDKASEIYTLTIAKIRFCVGAFKDSACVDSNGDYTEDREKEFISRYSFCIDGGKLTEYFEQDKKKNEKKGDGDGDGDGNGNGNGNGNGDGNGNNDNIVNEKYSDGDKAIIQCVLDMIKDGEQLEKVAEWFYKTVNGEQTEEQTEEQK